MNTEQSRAIAKLLREQARLIRDLTAATGLLRLCQEKKICPLDYERDLEEIKQTPEYKKLAEGLDLVASHLEQVSEGIDLSELLQKPPKAKKSN